MYDVGELSMIIVSRRLRPTWERSYNKVRVNPAGNGTDRSRPTLT